jgi:putative transcriptional regulator
MIAHHPSEETLLAYASGNLDEAHRVVVATHLTGCATCRAVVLLAERVGGDILESLATEDLRPGALEACLQHLDAPRPAPSPPTVPPGLPATLAGYRLGRLRRPVKGLGIATILPPSPGRAGLHLLHVAPGMNLPPHGHGGLELTAVLQGAFEDDDGIYRPGDVAETGVADHHTPVALAGETCICLFSIDGRLRFDHWLARLVQPLFGI